jgi:hypothetical protein
MGFVGFLGVGVEGVVVIGVAGEDGTLVFCVVVDGISDRDDDFEARIESGSVELRNCWFSFD